MFRIHYKDPDPGCPVFTMRVKADDYETAEEAFWDTCHDGDLDWEIVKIERIS